MKTTRNLLAAAFALFFAFIAAPAFAQNNGSGGGGAVSPGQVRNEVRGFINDLNDPNYDYSKVPDRMRELFQDFRTATDGMDPDEAQRFRMDLFQQLGPVLQANQKKIQDAWRLSILKSLQEPLGCSDDEFAAIRPYLEKVFTAMDAARVVNFGGFRGPGQNQQGNNSNQTQTPVQKAVDDLQTTLKDPNAPSDLIHNKLDVLRQARDKAQQDLTVARGQLEALLTRRQEAVLVEYGLLD